MNEIYASGSDLVIIEPVETPEPTEEPVLAPAPDVPLRSMSVERTMELTAVPQDAAETDSRPFLTTDFSEYSVTEGLLLLLVLFLFIKQLSVIIRRAFSWLT